MIIRKVLMNTAVEEKVFKKHGVGKDEIEATLLENEPRYFKTSKGRYLAIGRSERFITAIFEYRNSIAEIITAYPSSQNQIRRYKSK